MEGRREEEEGRREEIEGSGERGERRWDVEVTVKSKK
jgi:hypothetical protein